MEKVKDDLCELEYFAVGLERAGLDRCQELVLRSLAYTMYIYSLLKDKPAKVPTEPFL